jgi:hypothetical protein
MLEIILLIFLCKKIGDLAIQKGENPTRWKWYTVLNWILFEILGSMVGVMMFGFDMSNMIGLMAFALASAFGGYLLVRKKLETKPDINDQFKSGY